MSAYYRHHPHSNSGQGSPLPKVFWIFWYVLWIGLGLLFVGIAVVGFVAGGLNYSQQEAFFARAEPATGTITSYQLHVRNSGLSEYCPVIEFTTKAGESFSYLGGDCPSAPDSSKIGQQVQLYYDPKNPNDNRTRGFGDEYTGLTVGVIAGVFFLLLGAGLLAIGFGVGALMRRMSGPAAHTARDQRNAAASAAGEAAMDARLRESLLAGGASEAEADEQIAKKRRAVEEWKARREGKNTQAESPAEAEARLAQLKQQEEALQRKIDQGRQQGQ